MITRPDIKRYVLLGFILMLTGCATRGPDYATTDVDKTVTPRHASTDFEVYRNTSVVWGGLIIDSANSDTGSELEVLAYPLNSNQKPDTNANPIGRFIVETDNFLEPLDYSQGRIITATGVLLHTRAGEVGSTNYTYPVVKTDQVYLWSKSSPSFRPQISIGVGVGFEL